MMSSILRKARQFKDDPVLRTWLLGKISGRWKGDPIPEPMIPPYLGSIERFESTPKPDIFKWRPAFPQNGSLELTLAGHNITCEIGEESKIFDTSYEDTESVLALHRFAWLPLFGKDVDPGWVDKLWQIWMDRFSEPDDSWAWHPYTAAERLINILEFHRRFGLPGPEEKTIETIVNHGNAILNRMEYFGEEHTGNHLTNNGRGLFLAGLELNLNEWVNIGFKILSTESQRILFPSGVLREGSSHYHLLVTRWFVECWLAAKRYDSTYADELETIASRMVAVLPHFNMHGNFPLIGDVSPDSPPSYLHGLLTHKTKGWVAELDDCDTENFNELVQNSSTVSAKALSKDGWLRYDHKSWSLALFSSSDGWSSMPGHGHRDAGSFELHFDGTPVFQDLGRRSYGENGDQGVSAVNHNSITIDGQEPYPANKAYYTPEFRKNISGPPPKLKILDESIVIELSGFTRLKNVGSWQRTWNFKNDEVEITDHIDGNGTHDIVRYFHTTAEMESFGLTSKIERFNFISDAEINVQPNHYWFSYGESLPASSIILFSKVHLPWSDTVKLKAD